MSQTIKGTMAQLEEMLEYYQGYLINNDNPNIRAKVRLENVVITFYATSTILFQGTDEANEYNIWANRFGLPLIDSEVPNYSHFEEQSIIGCDEVGCGDYFGPIVVSSAFVSSEQIPLLKKLGVKDSKLLTDDAIINIALEIKNIVTHSILVLAPEKFNALYKTESDNLNFIKACLHNNAINSILKKLINVKYDAIIIDEFTPKEKYFHYLRKMPDTVKDITLIKKAERVHLSVAAASILARATFLKEMKKLGNIAKVELLKGAGAAVDRQALSIVKSQGTNILRVIAKLKFANTKKIYDLAESGNIKLVNSRDGSL